MKRKGEEEGWKDKSKEGQSNECISHSMSLQCVDTLLDYMGQTGLKYSDITAARKIRTAVRRSLHSSQKQLTITHYPSQMPVV
jgi:hypothetical protein